MCLALNNLGTCLNMVKDVVAIQLYHIILNLESLLYLHHISQCFENYGKKGSIYQAYERPLVAM